MVSCNCGAASKLPIWAQMLIILVVSLVIFLVIPPIIIYKISASIGARFEKDLALANVNRGMAHIYKSLLHESEVLVAYSVWDDMADATDSLISGTEEGTAEFMDFIYSEYYDFGKWSQGTCGSFLAVYNKTSEDDTDPNLLWLEYHKIDPNTLEMDLDHFDINTTPSIFKGETEESKKFIREMTAGENQFGFIALDGVMLSIACQPIIHSKDESVIHGYLCRATEIHSYLEGISAGAGACISMFNMVSDEDIPKEFDELKVGKRTKENKFDGDVTVLSVKTDDWEAPSWPTRMCGPAELLQANSSTRTLLYFRLSDSYVVSSDDKKVGFGFIFDNPRDLEPILDENFLVNAIALEVFGFLMFLAYGLFTEFAVLRKLNLISKATYEALVENNDDDYEDYYTKPSNHGKKKEGEQQGSNEIFRMATLAAQTLEKNASDLKKKKNDLILEKMQSSLFTDQLRLINLYCARSDPDMVTLMEAKNGKSVKSRRQKNSRPQQVRKSRSIFFTDVKRIRSEAVTLERVLNDPFAMELLKNYCVKDSLTHKIRYPARRCLLFLLSALFYRSLAENSTTENRIECLKSIMEEFFAPNPLNSGSIKSTIVADEDLGIPDSLRATLYARGCKYISQRKAGKSLFDEACNAVREHLARVIFPSFTRTPAFKIIEEMFAEKNKLFERVETYEFRRTSNKSRLFGNDDSSSSSEANEEEDFQKELIEMRNTTEGTQLSRKALKNVTKNLFE